jgi:MFS family permease
MKERLFTRNFILVCLSAFTHFISFQLLLATLPLYVINNLGGRESDVGLLMGATAIIALATRPISGWAVEAIGRKPVMLYGSAAFTIATITYAIVGSVPGLFIGRLIHGTGIGTSNTASAVYVADQAPAKRRGEAMGYYGMSQSMAQAIGPALGLALMEAFGFPVLFAACIALSVASLLLALLLGEQHIRQRGLRLAWRMFISPRALSPAVLAIGLAFATGAVSSFIPLYGRAQGVSNPGFFFTILAIAMFVARPLSGSLSDRLGRMSVIIPGVVVIGVGLGILAYSGQWWSLVASALLMGLGVGTAQPALMALMIDVAGMKELGGAMSTYGIGMDIGVAIGSMMLGVIIERSGFGVAFGAAAMAPLVTLILFFGLRRAGI